MPDLYLAAFSGTIQEAINKAAEKRQRLIIDGGPYSISQDLKVPSNSTLIWHNGSTFTARPGVRSALLDIHKAHSVTLINPQLDINKRDLGGRTVHGIRGTQSNVVRIDGGSIRNTPGEGDGIYMRGSPTGGHCNNWWVRETLIQDCNRNGVGAVSARYSVFDSVVIRRSGHAGIDIEPDEPQQRAVALCVRNCICTRNKEFGLVIYSKVGPTVTGPMTVIGNVIEENGVKPAGGGVGVYIAKFAPVQLIGNVIRNNKGRAISHDGTNVGDVGNIGS